MGVVVVLVLRVPVLIADVYEAGIALHLHVERPTDFVTITA